MGQRNLSAKPLCTALGASPSSHLACAMSESESFEFSFNKEVFSDCLVTVAVSEGAAGVKRKRGWGLFGGNAPEKAEFFVTKALLARASPVFRELIEAQGQASSGKALLRLSVASSDQFRYVEAVLRHIYTNQLSLTSGALARAPSLALAEIAVEMMLSMLSMMTVTILSIGFVHPPEIELLQVLQMADKWVPASSRASYCV